MIRWALPLTFSADKLSCFFHDDVGKEVLAAGDAVIVELLHGQGALSCGNRSKLLRLCLPAITHARPLQTTATTQQPAAFCFFVIQRERDIRRQEAPIRLPAAGRPSRTVAIEKESETVDNFIHELRDHHLEHGLIPQQLVCCFDCGPSLPGTQPRLMVQLIPIHYICFEI
jgi:hypothetical protein